RRPRGARRELAQRSGLQQRRSPGQRRRGWLRATSLLALSLEPRLRRLVERHRENPGQRVPEGPPGEAVAHRLRHREITEKEAHGCAAEEGVEPQGAAPPAPGWRPLVDPLAEEGEDASNSDERGEI